MKYEREYLNELSHRYLETLDPAAQSGYVCPICGSGTHGKGTGMTVLISKDGRELFTCWNCHAGHTSPKPVDCFHLEGIRHGLTSFPEKVKAVEAITQGIEYDPKKIQANRIQQTRTDPTDFREYFRQCNEVLRNSFGYLSEHNYTRGISLETLNRFHVGYDKYKKCLIIPTSARSYLERRIFLDSPIPKKKHGQIHLFNLPDLWTDQDAVFVVEGEIDALSILDHGFPAVGLGGTGQIEKFLNAVRKRKPTARIIIALDNDDAGKQAAERMKRELDRMNVRSVLIKGAWE